MVLAVIGILAAILIPAIGGVRERAERVRCMNNLRTWGTAIHLYAQDNNGEIQFEEWANVSTNHYGEYLITSEKAPAMEGESVEPLEYFSWCPSTEWSGQGGTSVGYAFIRPLERTGSGSALEGTDNPIHTSRIANPAELLLMIDATGLLILESPANLDSNVEPICTGEGVRHGGAVNALFADGHVSTYAWEEIDRSTPEERRKVEQWFLLN